MPEPSTRKSTRMRSSDMPGHVRSKNRFYQRASPITLARAGDSVIPCVWPRGSPPPFALPSPGKACPMSWPSLGLRLLLLAAGLAGVSEEKKPVPLYTNDDLERVSPHRDETGVDSKGVGAARPAASHRAAEGRR